MRKLLYISIIAIASIIQSCEQVVDGDLEHVEKLVVYGIIENGSEIDGIRITKTLPPLGNYELEDSFVNDARGTISINGGPAYNLSVKGFGGEYFVPNSPIVESGDSLYLRITWKDNVVTASTVIPEEPEIDYLSGYINEIEEDWGYSYRSVFLFAHLKNLDKDLFYIGGSYFSPTDIYRNQNLTGPGESFTDKVALATGDGFFRPDEGQIDSIQEINELFVVEAYPRDFGPYWNTRYDGQGGGGGFLFQEGRNPIWNVEGGIGIFFGKSSFAFRSSNYTIVTDEP